MTGIWRKCLAHWDKCRQKGQILVFTAVLLPLLIAACGFTVDFGNMYMHKSKLQNAADAAAIAGGYAFRDNKENIDDHPKADKASEESAKRNLSNFNGIGQLRQARVDKDGVIYYRVELSESVPIYFLRLFGVGDRTTVSADSIASIVNLGGGKNNIFQNLFSFGSGGFASKQANQNPDNVGISLIGESSFYQGDIRGIGSDAKMPVSGEDYSHELLTFAARDAFLADRSLTVKQLLDRDNIYDNDKTNDTYEYHTLPTKDLDHQLDENLKNIVDAAKGHEYIWSNNEKKFSDILAQAANNNFYIYNTTGGNPEIRIDCLPPKSDPNDNRPLYIVCNDIGNIYFENKIKDRNSRPIIIVYTGTKDINVHGATNDEATPGSYFHGIIYAPYSNVLLNDQKLSFYGSIASKGLTITGKGTYEIDKTIGGGDGNSTGNGTASSNATVGLTSPPADISWD